MGNSNKKQTKNSSGLQKKSETNNSNNHTKKTISLQHLYDYQNGKDKLDPILIKSETESEDSVHRSRKLGIDSGDSVHRSKKSETDSGDSVYGSRKSVPDSGDPPPYDSIESPMTTGTLSRPPNPEMFGATNYENRTNNQIDTSNSIYGDFHVSGSINNYQYTSPNYTNFSTNNDYNNFTYAPMMQSTFDDIVHTSSYGATEMMQSSNTQYGYNHEQISPTIKYDQPYPVFSYNEIQNASPSTMNYDQIQHSYNAISIGPPPTMNYDQTQHSYNIFPIGPPPPPIRNHNQMHTTSYNIPTHVSQYASYHAYPASQSCPNFRDVYPKSSDYYFNQ